MNCYRCSAPMREGAARCAACGKWHVDAAGGPSARRVRLGDAVVAERDRVHVTPADSILSAGGGFPVGTASMLGGEPGSGKSTLALQWAACFDSCLYVAAEESIADVRRRAERLGARLLTTVDVVDAMGGISIEEALAGPDARLVVLDSLPGLVGIGPASDADAVACLKAIKRYAVERSACGLVIDHATKQDGFAGRLALQHEVDATLLLTDGALGGASRVLVARKNRSGPAGVELRLRLGNHGFTLQVDE